MTIHTCPRCGYSTNKKFNIVSHLTKDNICDPKIEDISLTEFKKRYYKEESKYYCDNCYEEFVYLDEYKNHIANCNVKNTEDIPDSIKELIIRIQNIEIITKKICKKCNKEKNVKEFCKERLIKDGYRNKCKECEAIEKNEYYNTLNGTLRVLIASSKGSAKKRGKIPGRELAGVHDITFEDLEELWEQQKGLCHHSKIPMNYDKHEWQVSLDRLNNDLGYIKSNIVLSVNELNGSINWSHEKIQEMLYILDQKILDNPVNFELEVKIRKNPTKITKSIINDVECYNCTFCDEIKPKDQFNKFFNQGCKTCRALRTKQQIELPRPKLLKLISSAKSNTKKRKDTKHLNNVKHDTEFDIDYDFLVEKFNQQKGLCAYSGIPLQFGNINEVNWVISLERKDTLKGYLKTNVCFICMEFNTSDRSIEYKEDTGNGGWTKEKFKYFIDTLKNN